MYDRRGLLLVLSSLPFATLPLAGRARAQAGRPPDNHFRLDPILLPIPREGLHTYARLVADLVLDAPTSRDAVRVMAPKIVGTILRENWEMGMQSDGRISADGAKQLKDQILRISRDLVGPQVQDVLIVSLIVG